MPSSEMHRHQQLGDLFLEARALAGAEQAAYLQRLEQTDGELSSWVARMLQADARSLPILDASSAGARLNVCTNDLVGACLGPYRLQRIIGAGGMGTVYEALQDHPRRSVALKVMQLGLTSATARQRFVYESEVLGRLRHPGIAQIYHAGVHEDHGRAYPYFAMELVQNARTIATHVNERRLAPRQIVEVFLLVCAAVHHGHQRGVIHRDLKPENILVDDEGQPKIIDFGVARAVQRDDVPAAFQTLAGQLVGTVAYMSPEQVADDAADIDLRTDVYALGVVLFELLTRQLPYDVPTRSVPQLLDAIRHGPVLSLHAADARLRGDLSTVLSKALERDRERRYASAAELRADLERWLRDEPVSAHPPSAAYQLRKFAKRNKALVGGIIAVFLALLAGISAERVRRYQALASERIAEQALAKSEVQSQRAQRVVQFLNEMLQSVTPNEADGRDVTVREVLHDVAAGVHEELADAPEVEATVRYILGDTYRQLGAYREAADMLRAAAAIHKQLGQESEETAHIHHGLGSCLMELNQLDEALGEFDAALGLAERILGAESDAVLQILNDRGHVYYQRDQLEEVAATLERVIEIRRRTTGEDDEDLHIVRVNLAMIRQQQHRLAEARDLLSGALTWLKAHQGEDHSTTILVLDRLGGVEFDLGNIAEADRLSREMIDQARAHFGPDHPELASALYTYGTRLQNTYREAEAETLYRQALRIRETTFGPEHVEVAIVLGRLGSAVAAQNRLEDGLGLQERALRIYRAAPDPSREALAWALHEYASILTNAGRYTDALAASREALGYLEEVYGADSSKVLTAKAGIAFTHLRAGEREGALALHQEVLQKRREILGDDHPDVTMAMFNLACNEFELGQFADARQTLEAVVPRFLKEYGEESTNHCRALVRLGIATLHDGDATTALQTAAQALSCPDFAHLPDARLAMLVQATIGAAHLERGELADAAAALEKCLQELELAPAGEDDWQSAYALLVQARILRAAGRNADAAEPAERAHAFFATRFGAEHPFTREAAELLEP